MLPFEVTSPHCTPESLHCLAMPRFLGLVCLVSWGIWFKSQLNGLILLHHLGHSRMLVQQASRGRWPTQGHPEGQTSPTGTVSRTVPASRSPAKD